MQPKNSKKFTRKTLLCLALISKNSHSCMNSLSLTRSVLLHWSIRNGIKTLYTFQLSKYKIVTVSNETIEKCIWKPFYFDFKIVLLVKIFAKCRTIPGSYLMISNFRCMLKSVPFRIVLALFRGNEMQTTHTIILI